MTGPPMASGYGADSTLERVGERVWLGGSPLRLFRVAPAGDELLEAVARAGPDGVQPASPAEARLLDHMAEAGAVHPRPQPSATPPEAGIVIPVRDDPVGLDRLLGLLGPGGPVVVVDDGSTDAAAHAEIATRHGAVPVRRDHAGGPGAARNAGAAVLHTELVLFLDADVVTPPGRAWMTPLMAHLADERVAAVAPRVRGLPRPGLLASYEHRCSPLDLGEEPARVAPGTRVSYLPAAALVVRRGSFEELGGYDEGLRFGEDVDLVWRLVESGARVRYEPTVEVEHPPRASWAGWLRQRVDYGSSAAALEARHPGDVAPAVLSPWSAVAWGAVAAGHPVLAVAIGMGSAAALPARLADVGARRAVEVALTGHLGAGRQLARAALRTWWPALGLAALFSRRARRIAAACVALVLVEAGGTAPERALAVADDLAYGTGVWIGAWRVRSAKALLPRLVGWPGRTDRTGRKRPALKVDRPTRR